MLLSFTPRSQTFSQQERNSYKQVQHQIHFLLKNKNNKILINNYEF